jgi:two-component system, NarL family, invasion response regulator UvrY
MRRMLIADDHSYVRRGVIQILKDEFPFAEIIEAANGDEMLKAASENDFDLIISDLEMPGKNGLEALEKVKEMKPHIPVLILSIHDEDLYAARMYKAGASGYLNKNSAPEELIKAIRQIQRGKRYMSEETAAKLEHHGQKKQKADLLSNREITILKLLAEGKSTSQISDQLELAPTTVSTYRSRILEKLQLHSNADLTRYALHNNIISDIK